MASVFNIDIADDSVVGNITFKDRDKKDKMRDHSSVSSMHSSRSLSVFSDKSTEEYLTRVQHESDNMDQDNPVASFDSSQIEYVTPKRQESCVSKAADLPFQHEETV